MCVCVYIFERPDELRFVTTFISGRIFNSMRLVMSLCCKTVYITIVV